MTINKYFVFAPQAEKSQHANDNDRLLEQETQRQALVKQAQQQGGL